MRLRGATRFLLFPLLLAMGALTSAAQDNNLLLLYRDAQAAQAAGQLAAATEKYEDLVKAGVIDPTKVARTALQNAASIAGLLLTTEAVVAEAPEETKKGANMSMPGGEMDY